jgi:hypothetical protein
LAPETPTSGSILADGRPINSLDPSCVSQTLLAIADEVIE